MHVWLFNNVARRALIFLEGNLSRAKFEIRMAATTSVSSLKAYIFMKSTAVKIWNRQRQGVRNAKKLSLELEKRRESCRVCGVSHHGDHFSLSGKSLFGFSNRRLPNENTEDAYTCP